MLMIAILTSTLQPSGFLDVRTLKPKSASARSGLRLQGLLRALSTPLPASATHAVSMISFCCLVPAAAAAADSNKATFDGQLAN